MGMQIDRAVHERIVSGCAATSGTGVLDSNAMKMAADLYALRQHIAELAATLRDLAEAGGAAASVRLPGDALVQLFDVLAQPQAGDRGGCGGDELATLGEFGLQRLEELSQAAAALDQPGHAAELSRTALPFALWIARRGGELRHLAPVVDALAAEANQTPRGEPMKALYGVCCELVEAASPRAQSGEPVAAHPWRLLLLNRAIVATRSESPELMQAAFDAVVEHLPLDAQRFFAEGMEQMAIIDYPDHVREVMRRYFLAHSAARRLH